MTKKADSLCERLKQLGFAQQKQTRLYGEDFELLSDPIIVEEDLVLIDAIEKRSKRVRRVRIPSTIVNMAKPPRKAA